MKKNITIAFLLSALFIFSTKGNAFSQSNNCKLDIGTNLGGLCDWMTEMPFVDMMHHARTWGTRNRTGWIDGGKNDWDTELADSIEVDENGYPLEVPFYLNNLGLEDSQIVFTVWASLEAWMPGIYTCLYDGEGEIDFGSDGKIISSMPGKLLVQITPSNDGGFLEMKILRSERGNHIRNIRLIMPAHEETYQSKPFNPLYIERLKPFKALRFMDWGQTNNWGHENSWTCYDGAEDTILTRWQERSLLTNYTWSTPKGVPYEMMCNLCNTLKKDMWICVPHCASDEYIREIARLVRQNLDPELRIYVEYSNEIWNWMFGQAQWLNTFYCVERNMDWPEGIVNRVQNNLDIWSNVFADDLSRITRVVGVQTAWQDVANRVVNNLKPESFDAIALTAYFGLGEKGDSALDLLGENATVADLSRCIREERTANEIGNIKDDYTELANPSKKKIVFYEAGQHITPTPFGEEPTYSKALLDIQRDTTIYNLYKEWFNIVENIVPDDEKTLYMNFSFIGSLSARYGSWGVLETLDQDTTKVPAPKYRALLEEIGKCNTISGAGSIQSEVGSTNRMKVLKRSERQFVVLTTSPLQEVELFDLGGRLIGSYKSVNSSHAELNLGGLSSGVYLLKAITTGYNATKKILIN